MINPICLCAKAVMLAVLVSGGTSSSAVQEGREALVRGTEAYDRAEFQTAVRLLSRGLDPMTGPQDSLWGVGVHMLADALIEQGATSLADVWLRWALRVAPHVNVDSINFPPAVTNAFLAARRETGESSADSGTASVTWEWSNTAGSPTGGAIRVTSAQTLVTVVLRGGVSVRPGQQRAVAAGTYFVVANADDHLPSQLTIEVLPGVTTVLDFELRPAFELLYVEDFESYIAGSFPPTWTPDANAVDAPHLNRVDESVSHEGANSLRLHGRIAGCWGAHSYRPLTLTPPYDVEVAIRNGNFPLSGCNPSRGAIGVRKGTSWSNPSRNFLRVNSDGSLRSDGGNLNLGSIRPLEWHLVRIRYERPSSSEAKVSYWIDGTYKGFEIVASLRDEDQLTNLEISVGEGTAWFDSVRVFHNR